MCCSRSGVPIGSISLSICPSILSAQLAPVVKKGGVMESVSPGSELMKSLRLPSPPRHLLGKPPRAEPWIGQGFVRKLVTEVNPSSPVGCDARHLSHFCIRYTKPIYTFQSICLHPLNLLVLFVRYHRVVNHGAVVKNWP